MEREFTPGALRALAAAATWQYGEPGEGLRLVTILMGLLSEPECRAAMVLRDLGIDEEALLSRWPELHRVSEPPVTPLESVPIFHPEVKSLFAAVDLYMDWGDWPPIISTEHLLLGLAGCDHPVAEWLRQRGLDFARLRQQILERYGTAGVLTAGEANSPLPETPEEPEEPFSREGGASRESGIQRRPRQPEGMQGGGPSEWAERTADRPGAGENREQHLGAKNSAGWEIGLYRIVDAAINRALEGLRVVEDYVRFVLDDAFLVGQLKELRHDLSAAVAHFPMSARLAARETQRDVGTTIKHGREMARSSPEDILDANLSRVREALRSIEECAKVLLPEVAGEIEQLRYRCYTLHRAIRITSAAVERLRHARLYVLVDGRSGVEEFRTLVTALVEAGVHIIQLRDKRLKDRQLLERARILRETTRNSQTLFIMNDRPDLAVLSGADGVHVGQEELTVKDARTIVGPGRLVGVSTHSIEQARQAVLDGADYIGCGPTFPSPTKEFSEFPGLDFLRQVAAEIRLPAFAIGGINESNLDSVLATGMRRVAVSAAVVEAVDPAAAARRMLAKLEAVSPA